MRKPLQAIRPSGEMRILHRIARLLKPETDKPLREWEELDSKALAFHRRAKHHAASDPNLSQAEGLYRQALEVAETSQRPLLIAAASNNLGALYADENRVEHAIPLYERALQLREENAGAGAQMTVNSLERLSKAYAEVGRWADTEGLERRMLQINRAEAVSEVVAESLNAVAVACRHQRKYSEAEQCYAEALSLLRTDALRGSPTESLVLHDWAFMEMAQEHLYEAEAMFKQALALREQADDDFETSNTLDSLADLFMRQRRHAEAAVASRRQVALVEKVVQARTSRSNATTLIPVFEQHAHRLEKAGQVDEALEYRAKAASIRATASPDELSELDVMMQKAKASD